uniref:Uncharacterized protein n=1 Tax=Paramormyrops kingsleyae TaxID=1676925 RepID=A0A3B3SCS7_9TELE
MRSHVHPVWLLVRMRTAMIFLQTIAFGTGVSTCLRCSCLFILPPAIRCRIADIDTDWENLALEVCMCLSSCKQNAIVK